MNTIRYLGVLIVTCCLSACDDDHPAQSFAAITANSVLPPPNAASPWAYRPCDSFTGDAGVTAVADAAADGIWQGTLTNELQKTSEPYTGLVAGDGRFFLRSTGATALAGTLTIEGDRYTGDGFADSGGNGWNTGALFSDLAVAGTIAEFESLTGEFTLASGDTGCFRLDYDAGTYERPSSLELLAGQWLSYDGWGFLWLALDVSADGDFSADGLYGCHYVGQFALIDARFNLYDVEIDITQRTDDPYPCPGPGMYDGFAYLTDDGEGSDTNHNLQMALVTSSDAYRIDMRR